MSHPSSAATAPGLLSLPTELHLQIMSHLTTDEASWKDYDWQRPSRQQPASHLAYRHGHPEYLKEFRKLAELALMSRQLTAPAQEMLYKHVSLPLFRVMEDGSEYKSRVLLFLRTITTRQDLTRRVERLAIQVQKGKIITEKADDLIASRDRLHVLQSVTERIASSVAERYRWMRDLERPTEALLAALIFATLPNLESVTLAAFYLRTNIVEGSTFDSVRKARILEANQDEHRLVVGLNTTSITSLALSNRLEDLCKARIPSLKTLTLEYTGLDWFGTPALDCFPNVETLIIQHPRPDSHVDGTFRMLMRQLFPSLPKLRFLDLPSWTAARWATLGVDLRLEKFTIREADGHALLDCVWDTNYLRVGSARFYELHWRKGASRYDGTAGFVSREGVEIVVKQKGEIVQIFRNA